MSIKSFIYWVLVFLCLIGLEGDAQDQPEKRVMEYLAVMDLNCGENLKKNECGLLTDIIIEEVLKSKKYKVVDRANRDKILSEVGFQQSGCTDESCTVEAGRILGVGKIITGRIGKLGATYLVSLQLINVETAMVEASASEECKCDMDGLIATVRNVARKLMGLESQTPPIPTVQPASSSSEGDMVLVPAGEFWMGCNKEKVADCTPDEGPYHKVYLDAFYIDKYEVTVKQYMACVKAGQCSRAGMQGRCDYGRRDKLNYPINCVNWSQARAYCKWVKKRLPTEAEWEKAARGTDGRIYPWGDEWNPRNANYCDASCDFDWRDNSYDDGFPELAPVGSFSAGISPYGVYDMSGNVKEWVADWYEFYYQENSTRNPVGPSSGDRRILRGGAWTDEPSYLLRVSGRQPVHPEYSEDNNGFRCVRTQ